MCLVVVGSGQVARKVSLCKVEPLWTSPQRCHQSNITNETQNALKSLKSIMVLPAEKKLNGKAGQVPCECCEVYIGETGRPTQERNRMDILLAGTQTSIVSEHDNKTGHHPFWNEIKFFD